MVFIAALIKETSQIKENNVTASHHERASVYSLYFLSVHHLFPPPLCLGTELKTLPRTRFENSWSVARFCDLFVTWIFLAGLGFWLFLSEVSLKQCARAHGLMMKWSSHSLSLCFARAMFFCQRTTKTKQKKIIPIGSHVNQRDSHLQKGAGLRGFIVLTDKAEWRWERFILLSARLVLFLSYLARSDIFYCQLSLGTKRTVDTRFTFFPSLLLLPFTSQQYCHTEKG